MDAPAWEKLGYFYLGGEVDPATGERTEGKTLYDARDLTTHGVCVGMTGSGKTGLCIGVLEEAAIDGVPCIAVDLKGDIANLMLAFPDMSAASFEPWVLEDDARRKGRTLEEHAEAEATKWREGIASWGQSPERVQRLLNTVDMAVYTPGSTAGLPLSILSSFAAPPPELIEDTELLQERVGTAVSGVLGLLGIDADPVTSREHILLSRILFDGWRAGRDLDLAALIGAVQHPGFDRIGVMELDVFFPAKDRMALAMRLNNLLASPTFAGWLEGEPLSVDRLLYADDGRPRLSIVSLAHLGTEERMFFLSLLLGEVIGWMRRQSGTTNLRALLYIDEIFGYLPPVANPPTKTPLLTLLKQARAFGLGLLLATQNPVDIDYKALSNAGTWFIGRLQTERDKLRLLDALESAQEAAGSALERASIDRLISGLGKRRFLLHNVHESAPQLFDTRWVLSYLRGPMARAEIKRLMDPVKEARAAAAAAEAQAHAEAGAQAEVAITGKHTGVDTNGARGASAPVEGARAEPGVPHAASPESPTLERAALAPTVPLAPPPSAPPAAPAPADDRLATLDALGLLAVRPTLPAKVSEGFVSLTKPVPEGSVLAYRACLLGDAAVHFEHAKSGTMTHREVHRVATFADSAVPIDWTRAIASRLQADALDAEPAEDAAFVPLAEPARRATSYTAWKNAFTDDLYRRERLTILHCPTLDVFARPDEDERAFRIRLNELVRASRAEQSESLRASFAARLRKAQEKVDAAERRIERERGQARRATTEAIGAVGSNVLGALFGGRRRSATRAVSRSADQRADVREAEAKLEAAESALARLQAELEDELAHVDRLDAATVEVEAVQVAPRRKDIALRALVLAWVPVAMGPNGASLLADMV